VVGRVREGFDPARDYVLVEGEAGWHLGVVGIVASRLVKEFHRPSIVFGGDGERWRGSGRSIEGFDLAQALEGCRDLIERGGGHAMAAGVSVRPERIGAFRARLNELARARLRPEQLVPVLRLDGEVSLSELDIELVRRLSELEPTGQGNPVPSFVFRGLRLAGPVRRMGREGRHVRLWVTDGGPPVEVVWWGAGGRALPDGVFELAAEPQLNEFNGEVKVRLRLLDWHGAG
jgi:single-stranded-DNA-specific exonuclease